MEIRIIRQINAQMTKKELTRGESGRDEEYGILEYY
jgi:hypothetical protein